MKSAKSWASFLIAASLVVLNHGAALDSMPKLGENKCNTDECIVERLDTATHVMRNRDSAADPCENMFQYICGENDGTDFSHRRSEEAEARDLVLKSFIGVVEALTGDFRPFKMIEEIHDVCTDDNARNKESDSVVKGIVEHLGGWPMVDGDKWKEADFDWMEFTGQAKRSGVGLNYFAEFESELDPNTEDTKMTFKASSSPTFYEFKVGQDTDPAAYKNYMINMAKLMGATGDVSKDVDDVIEFQKKLHSIDPRDDDKENVVMEADDLKKDFPGMDWDKLIEKSLKPFMDEGEVALITVWNVDGMKEFIKLMSETPKRVQANYAIWRILAQSAEFMSPEFQKEAKAFREKLNDKEIEEENYCDEMAKYYMEEAMAYFMIHQFKSSAESMQNMVQGIKDAMVSMMKDSTVLDAEDKEKGSKAINDMPVTMGPSRRFSDPKELETLYAETQIDMGNMMQTLVNLNMFRVIVDHSRKLKKDLNMIADDAPAGMEAPTNVDNHLYIPVEMLESSSFDNNRPMYMNYGSAGVKAAQEIFVSVDELSRMETEGKEEVPTEQMKCFANVFNNTDPETGKEIGIDAVEGLIGQFMALRSAYKAYKDYEAKNGAEAPLPEVPMTAEQLFWASFVGNFCNINPKLESMENYAGTDMKLPEYLIQKMLSNIPEISNDFSCPVGSMLNPATKCTWW